MSTAATTPEPAESELTPELIERVMRLSADGRAKLRVLLGEPVPNSYDSPEAPRAELQRRVDAYDRGEIKGYTREEAMARVRAHVEQLRRTPHPDHLHGYSCVDYFSDGWAENGFYDDAAHYWVVEPLRDLSSEHRDGFFAVGGPGVDSVRFCYRYGHNGVWAYYPLTREFVRVANNLNQLVEKWRAGQLAL